MTLSKEIVRLSVGGMKNEQIARKLGCSAANVSLTLQRKKTSWISIPPLEKDKMDWLITEAENSRLELPLLVRAILIDAIDELMDENDKPPAK